MIWSWTLSPLVVLIFLSSSPGLLLPTCFCRRLLVLVCLSLPSRPSDVHVLTKTLSLVFACLLSPVCPHLIVLDSFSGLKSLACHHLIVFLRYYTTELFIRPRQHNFYLIDVYLLCVKFNNLLTFF